MVDPISAFRGPVLEIHATLVRLTDICKSRGITTVFTSLSAPNDTLDENHRSVSSLMDTWIELRDYESNGERNRVLSVLKSRGMRHSKQVREYQITDRGIELINSYVGPGGALTGTARLAQEARERDADRQRAKEIARRRRDVARKRAAMERQIADLQAELQAEEAEMTMLVEQDDAQEAIYADERSRMATERGAAP